MEPTFTRQEIEAYLEMVFYKDELEELYNLFVKQKKRYCLNDAVAIANQIVNRKTYLIG